MGKARIAFLITIFFGFTTAICAAQNTPSDVARRFYRACYDRDTTALLNSITPTDRTFLLNTFGEGGMAMFLNIFMGAMYVMFQGDLSSLRNVIILSEQITADRAVVIVAVEGAPPLNLVRIGGVWKIDMGFASIMNLFGF